MPKLQATSSVSKLNRPIAASNPIPPQPQDGNAHLLLDGVLAGVVRDLPEPVGAALTVREFAVGEPDRLRTLAAWGCGALLVDVQTRTGGGPTSDARGHPVVTCDLWNDRRWPRLSLMEAWTHGPRQLERLRQAHGIVAMRMPGDRPEEIVLSVALAGYADHTTLQVLIRHEVLVASAVAVLQASAANGRSGDDAFLMVQSRASIEQAKGIVMSLRGCSPDQAWRVLRDSSAQLNVKVRNLAVAMIEYLADSPVEPPLDSPRRINPSSRDRQAAAVLWRVLHDCHQTDGLGTIELLPIPPDESKPPSG